MQDHLSKVYRLIEGGQIRDAEQAIRDVLAEDPQNGQALYLLGLCLLSTKNYAQAQAVLEESITIEPESADTHIAIAEAFTQTQQFRLGELHLIIALSLEPDSPRASLGLARLYEGLDRHKEALVWYELSESLSPSLCTEYELAIEYARTGDFLRADWILSGIEDQLPKLSCSSTAPCSAEELQTRRTEIEALFYDQEGFSLDLARAMVWALNTFANLPGDRISSVSKESEALVHLGILKNLDGRYRLWSLNLEARAVEIVCLMYAGFRLTEPTRDIGFDLSKAYSIAMKAMNTARSA